MRFFYYVSSCDDGHWDLVSSLQARSSRHSTREEATANARQHCRRHWEDEGYACGVRVRGDEQAWVDEFLVGDDVDS